MKLLLYHSTHTPDTTVMCRQITEADVGTAKRDTETDTKSSLVSQLRFVLL